LFRSTMSNIEPPERAADEYIIRTLPIAVKRFGSSASSSPAALPFVQQLLVRLGFVAFETIERLAGRIERGEPHILLYGFDGSRGVLQALHGLRRRWLALCQGERDFRKPAELPAIARDFRHHAILDDGIAGIVDRQR